MPFSIWGRPAFGCINTGTDAYFINVSKVSFICIGPNPQFIPIASAPKPSSKVHTVIISAPVSVRPFSSNVIVAITGRFVFSLIAKSAAFASYVSDKVSSIIRSAPYFSPNNALSLNIS